MEEEVALAVHAPFNAPNAAYTWGIGELPLFPYKSQILKTWLSDLNYMEMFA